MTKQILLIIIYKKKYIFCRHTKLRGKKSLYDSQKIYVHFADLIIIYP